MVALPHPSHTLSRFVLCKDGKEKVGLNFYFVGQITEVFQTSQLPANLIQNIIASLIYSSFIPMLHVNVQEDRASM